MSKIKDQFVGGFCRAPYVALLKHFMLAVFVIASFSGCGGQVYRERVEETATYFHRLAERDSFLAEERWQSQWVSLRLPARFDPHVDDENALFQPLSLIVPGLLGSWKNHLASDKDVFLLLGDSRLPNGDDIPIGDFEQTLIDQISTLRIDRAMLNKSRKPVSFPAEVDVVDQVKYLAYEFEIPTPSEGIAIGNFKSAYIGKLYFHHSGKRKIAILFLHPKQLEDYEMKRLQTAISFSLETLLVVE